MIGELLCYAVVYIAEAITALWYMEYLFARKRKMSHIIPTVGIGYLLLYGVSLLEITVLNTVSFFLVNFVVLYTNYLCARKTAILHSAFLSFIMTVAEILVAILISFFVNDFAAYTYDFSIMVIMAVLSKLLYLVFALTGARVFSPHKQITEEPHMMVLFCSLPIISAVVSVLIVYIGLRTELTESAEIMMLVNVLALLVVNLIFMMLYNYIQKSNADNLALQLSIQREEADTEYYKTLQEQLENQRILIHDIKNHLTTIEGLAACCKISEITEYISQLESTLKPTEQSRLCTDPILNILLYRFIEECNAKGVDVHLDLRENCTSFMDAPSITTLYGNLLSNALQAASTSHEKIIELSVIHNSEQALILISVVNSSDTAPIPDNFGGFRTTKTSGIHGVGLKSIDRVIRKYNGMATMYYDKAEKKFHHIIHFPVKQ